MKRIWIFFAAAVLLLAGCARQDRHPEWDRNWTRFGDLMAVESPEGFSPGEYNDALSVNGIWYAVWNCDGEPVTIVNADGEEAAVYDAQIYLVLKTCGSEDAAESEVAGWTALEAQSYEAGDRLEVSVSGQRFSCIPLLSAGEDNPYSFGAAAFAVRGELAISAELLCADGFQGDDQAVLEQFLAGIHYGE